MLHQNSDQSFTANPTKADVSLSDKPVLEPTQTVTAENEVIDDHVNPACEQNGSRGTTPIPSFPVSGPVEMKEQKGRTQNSSPFAQLYMNRADLPPPPTRDTVIGEMPDGYTTRADRRDLLAEMVRKLGRPGAELRMDLLGRKARDFIDGNIEVLFQTHLQEATHDEVRAANKRASRRRTRKNGKNKRRFAMGGANLSNPNGYYS